MSATSDESLPVLLNSIQTRMVSSQRELSTVQAQMKGRSREARVQELTMEQLQKLGPETRLYKAIGKMFMEQSYQDIMNEAQKRRDDALEENKMLEKKVTFYEKEANEAQTHLQDLVKSLENANTA